MTVTVRGVLDQLGFGELPTLLLALARLVQRLHRRVIANGRHHAADASGLGCRGALLLCDVRIDGGSPPDISARTAVPMSFSHGAAFSVADIGRSRAETS